LWLHNQAFYRALQEEVVEFLPLTISGKTWVDIGCSTGLMPRLVRGLNYKAVGYDINGFSLMVANLLSFGFKNIEYKQENLYSIDRKFDIVSATSLLSVVDNKEQSLDKLISLLKDDNSTLIIIEPTKNLSLKNVWKLINGLKSFWFYKGLLLWAKARENKHIDSDIFGRIKNIDITQKYYLSSMVCVTYIKKLVVV
jgi:2-polyprenyl-3-methyl-5-hydroxy-6-metoxy-1,4-benzoquinol methylase